MATNRVQTLKERKKFYRELAEADMFEREVKQVYERVLEDIKSKKEGYANTPFLKEKFYIRPCLHCVKSHEKNSCLFNDNECALFYARVGVEESWEMNGRGV